MKFMKAIGTALALLWSAAPAGAKSLDWKALEVKATLDADGVLHVLERQNIVFDGDWNGGERKFRLEPGQELKFNGITRIDPDTGEEKPLREGFLSEVDHYDFTDPKTLRWRSRLPSDPPFSNREIDYVLDYSLSGILVKRGDAYVLDHDFAFPNRDGNIERFTLDLDLDSSWTPETPLARQEAAGPISPGRGFVVTARLRSSRPVAPAAVRHIPILGDRRLGGLLLAAGVFVFGLLYWLHDRARGRFAPLRPASQVDAEWLEANVFDLLPEEVGTAIDDDVGAPEVSATLARLVAEKKLRSESATDSQGKPTMRLTLLAPETSFRGYERKLVEGLFFGNESVTPDDVRAHYKSSGFNPARKIEPELKAQLAARGPFADTFKPAAAWRSLLFFAASVGLGVSAWFHQTPTDPRAFFFFLFASAFLGTIGIALSKKSSENFRPWSVSLLVGLVFVLAPWAIIGLAMPPDYSPQLFAAFTAFTLMFVSSFFHMAMSRDGAARMERRRQLAAARRFFRDELKKARPNLKNEWFPYLLALGLESGMERWSKAFAGEAAAVAGTTSFGSSSGSSFGGSGWTGGGGSFGGAGASASWGAAVGGFAAGVASPSSSSGGGGGGGGSSGGGGGGGW
jgi:hypothetical protein